MLSNLLALLVTGNKMIKELNLEAVLFSLGFGLLIGNLVTLPVWLKRALATELFVKIGLVLLGTTIIWGDILKAGSLSLEKVYLLEDLYHNLLE